VHINCCLLINAGTEVSYKCRTRGYDDFSSQFIYVRRSELFLEDHKLDVDINPKRNSVSPSSALSYSLPVLEEMMGLKLYTNYHLPNVTEIIKSPMVIFNGPLRLNIFLLKSDVKVNKYVMEYKWLTSKVSEIDFYTKQKANNTMTTLFRKTLLSASYTKRPDRRSNIT